MRKLPHEPLFGSAGRLQAYEWAEWAHPCPYYDQCPSSCPLKHQSRLGRLLANDEPSFSPPAQPPVSQTRANLTWNHAPLRPICSPKYGSLSTVSTISRPRHVEPWPKFPRTCWPSKDKFPTSARPLRAAHQPEPTLQPSLETPQWSRRTSGRTGPACNSPTPATLLPLSGLALLSACRPPVELCWLYLQSRTQGTTHLREHMQYFYIDWERAYNAKRIFRLLLCQKSIHKL